MKKYLNDLKWAVMLLAMVAFTIITFLVIKFGVLEMDNDVYYYIINHFSSNTMTKVVKVLTNMGHAITVIVIAILALIFLKKDKMGWAVAINLVSITVFNQGIKRIIRRPRPLFPHLVVEDGFSFPSGHAMVSMAFYGFLIYLVYKHIENKYLRWGLIVLLSLVITIIGLSRIYLGVHYATDILGGFVFSIGYLVVFTHLYEKYLVKYEK